MDVAIRLRINNLHSNIFKLILFDDAYRSGLYVNLHSNIFKLIQRGIIFVTTAQSIYILIYLN